MRFQTFFQRLFSWRERRCALVTAPVLLVSLVQVFAAMETPADMVSTGELLSGALSSVAIPGLAITGSLFLNGGGFPLRDVVRPRLSCGAASRKGIVYGGGMITLLIAFTALQSCVLSWLGIEEGRQVVFTWLESPAYSKVVKLVLVADAVLLAPILEEMMYRGIFFGVMATRRRRFWIPALISGCYFALMHLHAEAFLPLLLFSLCTSYAYWKSGRIVTPILMHLLYNVTSVLVWVFGG